MSNKSRTSRTDAVLEEIIKEVKKKIQLQHQPTSKRENLTTNRENKTIEVEHYRQVEQIDLKSEQFYQKGR